MSLRNNAGNAIVYCEGAFGTTNGKTAHGLVRRSDRFRILSIVDSRYAGADAGAVLDGAECGIPIFSSIAEAAGARWLDALEPTHLIVGLAPDGGRLTEDARRDIASGIELGLDVISGLHDWLSEDPWLSSLALDRGVNIIDIRKPPPRHELHFFCGKIEEVSAARIAVLGADSAVGKRTTAWMLVDALGEDGLGCELVGTGQTAWLQGARHSICMDAIMNDFVAGEIEHAVWKAWKEEGADVLVVEGQGSLMNPAYPGGFEVLAAARPHAVVFQHAPARREYDGLPGYPIHPLDVQIFAIEIISGVPVVAVTVNSERLTPEEAREECVRITLQTGLVAVDPLLEGIGPVVEALAPCIGLSSPAGLDLEGRSTPGVTA